MNDVKPGKERRNRILAWFRIWVGLLLFGGLAGVLLVGEHRLHIVEGVLVLIVLSCILLYLLVPGRPRTASTQQGTKEEPPSGRERQ
ncbi:MAG: hypothetical protein GTN69_11975 [Armatimonadetes bacterium]|nr:hypothetical protein [Armatimonadota bacterium]